jgi:hypothetical protein
MLWALGMILDGHEKIKFPPHGREFDQDQDPFRISSQDQPG